MDTLDFLMILAFAGISEEIGRYIFGYIPVKNKNIKYVIFKALFLAIFAIGGMVASVLFFLS